MTEQIILSAENNYINIDSYLTDNDIKSIFLVCGNSINRLKIGTYFDELDKRLGIEVVRFSEFEPNPSYESVVEGVKVFKESKSDIIIAVGGGSAMDVAKCIKLYSNMDSSDNYLKQTIVPNDIKFAAVPTTAGTGSEATRYAVIYYNGEKQSVADYSCIPEMVVMDASTLDTLPDYHRKATMMDALCHAIESFWSVNSTEESRRYSAEAIKMIKDNKDAYLANEEAGNINMLKAANIAGKAINITQTTAGHAMCYKLTSLYGVSHGHAAALCVSKLWPYMKNNTDKCIDSRGEAHLQKIFKEIDEILTVEEFNKMISTMELEAPQIKSEEDFELLKTSVNPVRLKNNPVELTVDVIDDLYHKILEK